MKGLIIDCMALVAPEIPTTELATVAFSLLSFDNIAADILVDVSAIVLKTAEILLLTV